MNSTPASPSPDEQHREQMQALQAEMHAKMRAAKTKRGLLIVHTGNGKGKTTAAFGMLVRMLAHGKKCGVVQFIKNGADPLERFLQSPNLLWHRVGNGFTWDSQNRAADIASCREGWTYAQAFFQDPSIDFVLLDELNIVLAYDYLPKDEVLAALRNKRESQHIVATGRQALPELMEMADLVTEMREVKHPFQAGIQAQRGIDF